CGIGYLATMGWQLAFVVIGGFLFFFSSRRRHTRSDRDWSSDVCSSDLCLEDNGKWGEDRSGLQVSSFYACWRWEGATEVRRLLQIGRASCRERVEMSVGAVGLKKKRGRRRGRREEVWSRSRAALVGMGS